MGVAMKKTWLMGLAIHLAVVSNPIAKAETVTVINKEWIQKWAKENPEKAERLRQKIAEFLARIKEARRINRFISSACPPGSSAASCLVAQAKRKALENKLTNDPLVRQGTISIASVKNCLYSAMVACSLLGGPDPDSQGLSPLSSLSGQELTMPLEHFQKDPSESGAK